MSTSVKEQIARQVDKLTPEQQQALLDYAERLQSLPAGTPGEVLLEHMSDFNFEPGEVDEMMRAIEEGCERIDWDEWK
jgi:hypothetical protein